MDRFSDLLLQLIDRWRSYKTRHPSAAGGYNVFQVLEVAKKEVVMCRLLADLLNPSGAHHGGGSYLRHFLSEVLGARTVTEHFLQTVQVEKEYLIPGTERRIDLAIYNDQYFLPLEVKIHAEEQPSQCYDYYQYARERNKDGNAKVCYLTIDGKLPSDYSLSKYDKDGNVVDRIGEEKILPISFRGHIVSWLRQILFGGTEEIPAEEREILMQYLQAIEDFTGAVQEDSKELAADLLLENEVHFRAGLQIADAMDRAKAALIRKVMEEFRRQMKPVVDTYGLEEEDRFQYYIFEEQATEAFYTVYSTYPGLNYRVGKLDERYELWFRIEVEHRLLAGFCVFDGERESEYEQGAQGDKMIQRTREIEQKLLDLLNIQTMDCQINNWWVRWAYLPTGSRQEKGNLERVPDFKQMNEAAIRLSDEKKRSAFVAECVKVIQSSLLCVLKSSQGKES